MKYLAVALLFIIFNVIVVGQSTKNKEEVDYVNPFIGTAEKGDGGLALSVGPPFTMTNFSPQTRENGISRMYQIYEDSVILGFIASHQPTVWMGDYGYVSVMPQVGALKTLPDERKMSFSHANEIAKPYYYAVQMKAGKTNSIKAEIAATTRCGIFQFTFPEAKEAHLIFQALNVDDYPEPDWMPNLNSKVAREQKIVAFIKIDKEKNEIIGYNPDRHCLNLGPKLENFKGYFVIQFDKPVKSFGMWNNDSIFPALTSLKGKKRLGAYVDFSTYETEKVKVKIATSFISIEQARLNMEKELPHWDLEKTAMQTRDEWQHKLQKIKVKGISEDKKTILYTAYYHTLLFPRQFSEYGLYYSAFDDTIHQGVSYTDFSLWDTFRALHPFLIFVEPQRVSDMITSLLQMYKEGGWLPMWPNPAETNIMIGTHADAVIADAYVKGIRGYDVDLAYEAMRKNAMMATECDGTNNRLFDRQVWGCYEGKAGLQFYHSVGYVPSDYKAESVSRTIEYGISDYSIAQVAKDLGKTSDYEKYMQWSKNYLNLYNPQTGFFAPRHFNGHWDKNTETGFTEGSPWTYFFGAMHDIEGMIDVMGGKEQFAAKLDQNFAEGHYRHDNEPGHHYIYLYNYCNQPWKTQELVRKHTTVNYRNTPDGINGNDDCGQMSAWYIFSVMGFYPVTPASGIYAVGAPQFPYFSLDFEVEGQDRKIEILAENFSEDNMYVQKVMLDGIILEKPFLSHTQIIDAKKLVFVMGPRPNYNFR